MAEVEKQQAITSTKVQILNNLKSQMEIQRMNTQTQLDMQKMAKKFEYDRQLKQMEVDAIGSKRANDRR